MTPMQRCFDTYECIETLLRAWTPFQLIIQLDYLALRYRYIGPSYWHMINEADPGRGWVTSSSQWYVIHRTFLSVVPLDC